MERGGAQRLLFQVHIRDISISLLFSGTDLHVPKCKSSLLHLKCNEIVHFFPQATACRGQWPMFSLMSLSYNTDNLQTTNFLDRSCKTNKMLKHACTHSLVNITQQRLSQGTSTIPGIISNRLVVSSVS